MTCAIREERPDDAGEIHALIEAAFRDAPYSDGTEAAIVDRLRADRALALSLVAVEDRIVGHVAFSRVTISDGAVGWYGLLDRLRGIGARGCVVLGEPAYYGRFGFRHDPRLAFAGPPARYFQMLDFAGEPPAGLVRYAAAFG